MEMQSKSNVRRQIDKTGGGEAETPPLTDVGEPLMHLLGWKDVTGTSYPEIGIVSDFQFLITISS
jgi:hypothetical protein